jgi:hypothetical protein
MKILVLAFLLRLCLSVPCGSYLPKDTTSCTSSHTSENYCCLLQAYVNSVMVTSCYPIQRTKYLALNDVFVLNDITYNVDCGVDMGNTCGNIYKPVSYKDCGKFSSPLSACCFYQYKDDTGCIWQGANEAGLIEYKGLSIVCSQTYIVLSLLFIGLILMVVLL